jgi:hypothetical protein
MVLFCGGLGWFFELEINQRREGVLTCWEDVARGAGGWRSYVGEEKTKREKSWGDPLPGGFLPFVFVKEKGRVLFGFSSCRENGEPSFYWFWTKQNSKLPKGWGGGFSVDKFRLGFFASPKFPPPPMSVNFSPPP